MIPATALKKVSGKIAIVCCILLICRSCFSPSSIEVISPFVDGQNAIPSDQDEERTKKQQKQQQQEVECGIWLAPSTIKGAGLGMYAGRDFNQLEEILPTGDAIVAIVDLSQHCAANGIPSQPFLWNEYTWSGDALYGSSDGRVNVEICSPGLGSAANSFLPIYNVEEWWPVKDATGLHRNKNPGVGSFSPYHNRKSTAKYPIQSGQELLVSYGDSWFEGRSHFGPIPLQHQFRDSQILIDTYKSFQQKVGDKVASKIWDVFVRHTAFKESRVIGAFHHDEIDEIDILTKTNTTLSELRKQQMSRSLSWLRQHGTCGDHLAARPSKTLPEAGRGAFASRDLPKGTVVAQLPLIHIPDRKMLEMYHFANIQNDELDASYEANKAAGMLGYQLLLNYCFGHKQSTLLLCPYSPLTHFVNHNQSLANVKLMWGRPETGNHMPELLSKPIKKFREDNTAKLAMELIAMRDIDKDEEIFLDYGDEWEEAWQEHVRNWQPVQGAEQYKSAADLNSDQKTRLPSIFEQLDHTADPFPPNVELKCDLSFMNDIADKWRDHYSDGTLENLLEIHHPVYRDCTILRSQQMDDGKFFYTVHMYNKKENEEEQTENTIAENLPKAALRFFDLPYTDDVFLSNVFRHHIGIPDDMFPQIWKNIEEDFTVPV